MADSCDPHVYQPVDKAHKDLLMKELVDHGYTVTGNYDIDTHNHGVKLHGDYDEANQKLTVSITDKPSVPLYDVCAHIWEAVDPAINTVLSKAITSGGSDADLLKAIGSSSGSLSSDEKKTFSGSLDNLGTMPSAGKTDKGQTIPANAAGGTTKPVASAAGIMDAVAAHPYWTAAIVAVLGVGVWKLWKK